MSNKNCKICNIPISDNQLNRKLCSFHADLIDNYSKEEIIQFFQKLLNRQSWIEGYQAGIKIGRERKQFEVDNEPINLYIDRNFAEEIK